MKILIEDNIWEEDFLVSKIFPPGELFREHSSDLKFFESSVDALVFCSRTHSYSEIFTLVKRINPKVVVCLSDEFISEDFSCFNNLGNHCELFLRQYHHPNYVYTENTLHIPLGYTNGCKSFVYEKKLNWSFFGNSKTDRQEMIESFKQLSPYFMGNSISKELMCKIYSSSFFVPCGRGNSSLDCFRLYEASMNGAIPVVVGSQEEIKSTFKYEEDPPWIFSENWQGAVVQCKKILEDEVNYQKVLNWWNSRVFKINQKVGEVLCK